MDTHYTCTSCGSVDLVKGLHLKDVPAHAVRLHPTSAAALAEPVGDLQLFACRCCAFVFNASYDETLHRYDDQYESTQSYSDTFNAFNRDLARSMLEDISALGPVVEIGCGNGELLGILIEMGAGEVVGFDPAFSADQAAFRQTSQAMVHATNFDVSMLNQPPSAIISKMTLEHVADPHGFLVDIARSIPAPHATKIFIQVPNCAYIFAEGLIGDLLYEHCNYFTAGSLRRAFTRAGIEASEIKTGYGGQYLLATGTLSQIAEPKADMASSEELEPFLSFSRDVAANAVLWSNWIAALKAAGRSLAFWGGASKAVGFLSVTAAANHFDYAIDINPRKAGSYLPGTPIPVVTPSTAADRPVTDILVCNPIYMSEIAEMCRQKDISAALHPMAASPPGSIS